MRGAIDGIILKNSEYIIDLIYFSGEKSYLLQSFAVVTLCIQSAHVFPSHTTGPIASRVDVGINRARDYSLTHSYTRLQAQSKYYARGARAQQLGPANKTARNRAPVKPSSLQGRLPSLALLGQLSVYV